MFVFSPNDHVLLIFELFSYCIMKFFLIWILTTEVMTHFPGKKWGYIAFKLNVQEKFIQSQNEGIIFKQPIIIMPKPFALIT